MLQFRHNCIDRILFTLKGVCTWATKIPFQKYNFRCFGAIFLGLFELPEYPKNGVSNIFKISVVGRQSLEDNVTVHWSKYCRVEVFELSINWIIFCHHHLPWIKADIFVSRTGYVFGFGRLWFNVDFDTSSYDPGTGDDNCSGFITAENFETPKKQGCRYRYVESLTAMSFDDELISDGKMSSSRRGAF